MNLEPAIGSNRKVTVLFVDDEPLILGIIPRLLSQLREEWEVKTATSAAQGLRMIEETVFDVVVSDLKMPGMGGVEFLRHVRQKCPHAARIIFSSYSDKQSVLDCLDVIHQFLPKPVPSELLVATIQRAAMMRSILPGAEIREKVAQMVRIPSMPNLYLELIQQLKSADVAIEDIAKTVSQDLGMTAQILKLVNSALFGLQQPTSCVADAISYVGIETVKYLALVSGIFSQFESNKLGGISMEILWRHSMRTASAAKLIAKNEGASRHVIADAFAAGLLHDLGKLVIASNYSEDYEELAQMAQARNLEWLVAEREAFGFDHAEVGGYLLGLWGLPTAVVEAVSFHHFPSRANQWNFTALTAVHAANVLVQTQRPAHGGIAAPQVDMMYLAKNCRPTAWQDWCADIAEDPSI